MRSDWFNGNYASKRGGVARPHMRMRNTISASSASINREWLARVNWGKPTLVYKNHILIVEQYNYRVHTDKRISSVHGNH